MARRARALPVKTFRRVLLGALLVFLVIGGLDIFPWAHADEHPMPPHKAVYLTPGFFFARQFLGLGLMVVLSLLFVRTSLRPDLVYRLRIVVTDPDQHLRQGMPVTVEFGLRTAKS